MSVKVGWSIERPRPPSIGGRHFGLFEYLKVNDGVGRQFVLGFLKYRRADLELVREKGYRYNLRVIGILRFAPDVSPQLFAETVDSIAVTGFVRGRPHTSGNGSSSEART